MAAPANPNQNPQARDLNSAILSCFSPNTSSPPFETRLVELAMALTTSKDVAIWADKGGETGFGLLAAGQEANTEEPAIEIARNALAEAAPEVPKLTVSGQTVVATVALPGATLAALCIGLPSGGQLARSLAYERATLMANLSFAQNMHTDLTSQSKMIAALRQIGSGELAQLQDVADQISKLTGAQYCGVGVYSSGKISDLVVSGQENFTKRAQLPVSLKASMLDAARNGTSSPHIAYAPRQNGNDGLVFQLEGAARNTGILPMAAAIYRQVATGKPRSNWTSARLVKLGSAALILLGIGLLPIPDEVDLTAQVEATEKRIVTAPLSATLSQVQVPDNARVVGGQTVLAHLDISEIELDLIATRSERAKAVLERETARAGRNAALLRNAELEVERLDARVSLLELQKTQGQLIAPISGIVVLGGLDEQVGSVVRAGDTLLQVVDPTELFLKLTITETQISKLSDEAAGIFRPDFDPSLRLPATISDISPALSLTEDIPTLQAKARFDTQPDGLRFGLKGVFAADRTYRPVWDIMYNALRDWVLLRVWF